jgi:hypothetical protein
MGQISAARTRSKNSELFVPNMGERRHRPADWGVIFFPPLQRAWP